MCGGAPVRRSLPTERSSNFSSLSLLLPCNFTSNDSVIKVCRRGKSVSPLNNTALGWKIRWSLNMNAPLCRVLIWTSGSAPRLLLRSDSGLHKPAVASQHFSDRDGESFTYSLFCFLPCLCVTLFLQPPGYRDGQKRQKTWEASSCALLIDSLDAISFRLKRLLLSFWRSKTLPASGGAPTRLDWNSSSLFAIPPGPRFNAICDTFEILINMLDSVWHRTWAQRREESHLHYLLENVFCTWWRTCLGVGMLKTSTLF